MIKSIDYTKGSVARSVLIYAVPLMLATIMQNLFSIVDTAVLGNMAGTVDVASIAATGTVSSLIINGAVGLSTGTAIVLARFIGQKSKEKIRSTVDTSLLTSVVLGLIVAVAGMFLAPVFLTVTNCPEECYNGALIYMRIVIAAAPATLLYNYGSAILRTLGDTKRPLIYIAIAGVVNVGLNIILCLILQNKVVAVALATVTSNLISAFLVTRRLCRLEDEARVVIKKLRFKFDAFLKIVRFGIPASISSIILPLGNLQITTAINSFGSQAIAGHSAAASIECISYAVSGGFESAAMTFMGRNIGAKDVDRVKKTFWCCMALSVTVTGSLGVLTYLTGELWLGLILGASSSEAIGYGMLRLLYVVLFMFVYAISTLLTSALNAFGYPMLTSITNIAFDFGFRVMWMQFIYPMNPKFTTIMLCYTASWLLNMSFYLVFFCFVYRRYVKKGICKKI